MTPDLPRVHRGTIFPETARVLSQQAHAGRQYVLRVEAPRCAARATPGSFVHVTADPAIPMRRPLSILRADPSAGWIEMLYKVMGEGLGHLASRRPDDTVELLGPIGNGFTADASRPRVLLLGGGVGIPPMIFLAETLRDRAAERFVPLALLGSELPFPFRARPSRIMVPGMPDGAIAAMPLLEEWGIASRLASRSDFPGCHDGTVVDLAGHWLRSLPPAALAEVAVYACGPMAMLRAVAALAHEWDLPCQVSVEEYMACAVGACAGCAIAHHGPEGLSMKRVCVDGPVFDSRAVFPELTQPK